MSQLGENTVLSVRDLSIDFTLRTHILHAVRNVSFELKRGETLCLVGESGSGKSVTARALLRIIDRPGAITGGSILLADGADGTDIAALDAGSKAMRAIRGRRIGLIFQEPMSSLSPVHTIGSQIMEVVRLHSDADAKTARERTIELLRQVEIPSPDKMIDRYTFEFSGGMRQRAMIAMALAANPDILIADEPTTALDVTTQAEILDLIKRLQVEHGMAMLLITHDMGIVAEVADKVAVMRFGRIVEHGPVDVIFHAAQHPYTRQLLTSTLKLEQTGKAAGALAQSVPILSVRNLNKLYEGRRSLFGGESFAVKAVDDASFDLYPGENLGIVGESGSGKTTLGRLILRVVEPSSGSVIYRGGDGRETEVTSLDKSGLRQFHRQVRLVFQDPFASLNPRMTVRDVIADPLIVNGHPGGKALDEKVAALMALVGLDPQAMERYPRVLRWPASAHRHRPHFGARSFHHHRRRSHFRARCLDPQPDSRSAARYPEAARPQLHLHFTRYFRSPVFLHPRRGDASRQDCRDRFRRGHLHHTARGLHEKPDFSRAEP
jgi:peptide/nickel transport system ATP-binding protein